METLKQQALDYTLGVLPKDESLLFEAMLETDEDAQKLLIEAQEDCANLSMTANPKTLGNEVRSRVMEHCEPRMDFNPFLESNDMTRLRDNFHSQVTVIVEGVVPLTLETLLNLNSKTKFASITKT